MINTNCAIGNKIFFRLGHHSTSDDSTAYRSVDEIAKWNIHTPLAKFRVYLESLRLWNEEKEQELINFTRKEVLRVFAEAENKSKPHWKELFTDVYKDIPNHIKYVGICNYNGLSVLFLTKLIYFISFRNQMNLMEKHLEEFKEHYPLSSFTHSK